MVDGSGMPISTVTLLAGCPPDVTDHSQTFQQQLKVNHSIS